MKFYQLTKENMQLKEMLEKEEITELDYQENKEKRRITTFQRNNCFIAKRRFKFKRHSKQN